MSMPTDTVAGMLCPNCQERIADTRVYYDEALFSEMRETGVGSVGLRADRIAVVRAEASTSLSQQRVESDGTVMLCAQCAAAYRRSVKLRVVGRRLMNVGVVVMVASAIVYGLFLSGSAQQGLVGLVVAILIGIGAAILAVGAVMYLSGRMLRRSATRFVGKLQK